MSWTAIKEGGCPITSAGFVLCIPAKMCKPVLYESHCHTPLCRHATGAPMEYAAVALQRGLAGISITCHAPTPQEWDYCMRCSEWPAYLQMCEEARSAFAGRLDVRIGVECDYMPGIEGYWRSFLGEQKPSTVLGSVHPHTGDYRRAYWKNDSFEYQRTYFDHLAQAAETGLFDTLAHPDLVKNTAVREWLLPRILPFIQKTLDRIARTGVAMELNTSGLIKEIPEVNPGPDILREIACRGIPIVLGSDAHSPQRVANGFEQSLELLQTCGFANVSFFVDRQRRDIPIAIALASLRPIAEKAGDASS